MKEAFEYVKFQPATKKLIATMNDILTEYVDQGYILTVRQLYYQLVARGFIPNNMRSYKRLVAHCGNGRKAGMINWAYIHDTARRTLYPSSWDDPPDIIEASAKQFRVDRWEDQPSRIIVMIEKDALAGVFSGPCHDEHIRLYPNRGYTSLSYVYDVAKLMKYMVDQQGVEAVHVLYFGDHDPSGMDMDRDIEERLAQFSHYTPFEFRRMALTMDQIHEYDPPPNPAKLTDSRAAGYITEFGPESWELDALEPAALRKLLVDEIAEIKDDEIWAETMEREKAYRKELMTLSKNYVKFWESYREKYGEEEEEEDDDA